MFDSNLIIVAPWSYSQDSIEFYVASKTYKYQGVPQDLINRIAKICDGSKDFENVLEVLVSEGWKRQDVKKLLESLIENRIVIDGTCSFKYFEQFISNPVPFSPNLSDKEVQKLLSRKGNDQKKERVISASVEGGKLKEVTSRRRSIRQFNGSSVSLQALTNILWPLYGITEKKENLNKRVIPSAGGLYPLNFHLILIRECGNLEKGVYKLSFTNSEVRFNPVSNSVNGILKAFLNPYMLKKAQGVLILSVNFPRSAEKYGNRSIRYCYIEAGHAIQNMLLQSEIEGVAACEVGGFTEKNVRNFLNLKKSLEPVTTVIFGSAKSKNLEKAEREDITVEWQNRSSKFNISTNIAFGSLSSNSNWSSGKHEDPSVALDKLASELIEWNSWGDLPTVKAKFENLSEAVHPEKILDYGQRDLSGLEISKFDEEGYYEWVKGSLVNSGKEVFILAELILYPYHPDYSRYASGNSSGCAAHFSERKAMNHALFELIERDAFMIWWLNRLKTPTIALESIPNRFRRRISKIEELGYNVVIKNLTLDLAPVIMVAARRKSEIFTCSPASSSNPVECLNTALSELETSICSHEQIQGQKEAPNLKKVEGPRDHGRLYKMSKFVEKADFVFETGQKIKFGNLPIVEVDITEFLHKADFNIIKIKASENQPSIRNVDKRVVVRTIVPGLVPITFGYRMEPLGMERVESIPDSLELERKEEFEKFIPHPLD